MTRFSVGIDDAEVEFIARDAEILLVSTKDGPCDYAVVACDRKDVTEIRDALARWLETGRLD